MMKLGHIVVVAPAGLDASGAIDRATALLAADGTISVLDVLPELPLLARAVLPDDLGTMHLRERERELTAAIDRLTSPIRAAVTVRVLAGNPAVAISRFVAAENADLVLKVSSGATPDAEFDALDRKLLRKCPCTVWLIAPGPVRPIGSVLAAVDVRSADADRALARRIVTCARAAAAPAGATVYVIHVWNVVGEGVLRRHLTPPDVENHIRQLRLDADAAFRALLDDMPDEILERHRYLVRGEPASAIAGMAAKLSANLIVIGTVAGTGLPGLVFGHTAETLLANVDCELLVVKPDGFVSPLAGTQVAAMTLPPIYA